MIVVKRINWHFQHAQLITSLKRGNRMILGITPEGEIGLIMVLAGLLVVGAIAAWSMTLSDSDNKDKNG